MDKEKNYIRKTDFQLICSNTSCWSYVGCNNPEYINIFTIQRSVPDYQSTPLVCCLSDDLLCSVQSMG